MKIVPINQIVGDRYQGGGLNIEWDRHVPEDYFEQSLLAQVITYNVWETVRSERSYMIPIPLKDAKDGCVAELSIPKEPNWGVFGELEREHWDDRGRLQGTIFIYDFHPSTYNNKFSDPEFVEYRKADAFAEAEKYPIFYSVVSSLVYMIRDVKIVFEFAENPFSQTGQTNLGGNGVREQLLPSLVMPPGHKFYDPLSHTKPRTVKRGYVPAPDKDEVPHISSSFPDKESYENWIDSSD